MKVGTTNSENSRDEYAGMCVTFEIAENGGVEVTARRKNDYGRETSYIFATLEEALNEVESVLSVAKKHRSDGKKSTLAVGVDND